MNDKSILRKENELAIAINKWGWKYHHMGIPTKEKRVGERYISHLKFYVSGFETSPFGIEWMRFEEDSPMPDIIKKVPHIAFEVEDIDKEICLHDLSVIVAPNSPAKNIRVAMIIHNDTPVELIQFS
ncbi:MAG: hypothetical protein HRT68_03445 [Flavobacteriaceae bacterium]|nr:hypothetical protein [Flavobacteriaceae bacterium]